MWYKIKKWFKEEFPELMKFFLLVGTSTLGFLFVYMLVVVRLDLPIWSATIALVLAFVSEFGLCQWIYKDGKKEY